MPWSTGLREVARLVSPAWRSLKGSWRTGKGRKTGTKKGLVPGAGLEPARTRSPQDFKSRASTNSATRVRPNYTLYACGMQVSRGLVSLS